MPSRKVEQDAKAISLMSGEEPVVRRMFERRFVTAKNKEKFDQAIAMLARARQMLTEIFLDAITDKPS
jgi:hypothetical protein